MSCPCEQDLVMFLLGDEQDRSAVDAHVRDCAACRREVERLRGVLARVGREPAPEPDGGFEDRIWERQRAALATTPRAPASAAIRRSARSWLGWGSGGLGYRRLAWAGAMAASIVVAFLAGLHAQRPGDDAAATRDPGRSARDRVLLVAVGDHLERARVVLVELSNSDDPAVLRAQSVQARTLIGDNRLYRQTAQLTGQSAVADVLDQVERVLLEVARTPNEVPADELAWLRRRIQERDLLFKVSVIEESARPASGRPRTTGGDL